ncbi:TPA: hypothetical protein DCX15_04565 [bacterium]|nr:hypothetical protein [bacterium]
MMKVRDFMSPNPIAVSTSNTFREVVELFYRHRFDIFPVVDEKKHLMGIISKTDLIGVFVPEYFNLLDNFSFVKDFGALEINKETIELIEHLFLVEDLMVSRVVTVDEETTLFTAIALMRNNQIKCLPVLREDKLVGIISQTDILKALLRE